MRDDVERVVGRVHAEEAEDADDPQDPESDKSGKEEERQDGQQIDFSGKNVDVKVPANDKAKKLENAMVVCTYPEKSDLDTFDAKVEGENVTFSAGHFSTFAIVNSTITSSTESKEIANSMASATIDLNDYADHDKGYKVLVTVGHASALK